MSDDDKITTLVPKDGINSKNPGVAPDGSRIPDAKDSKFALFTQDWLDMQRFVAGALQLPISVGDFDKKYGAFGKKQAVLDAVDAFKDLADSAKEFGDPNTLLKERQTLMGGEKPDSIYGEIIWLANQIANTANTFNFTFNSLKDVLTPALSRDERREALKEILTGRGGLRDSAVDMETKANALVQRLAAFSERIGKNQKKIDDYASEKADIYIEASNALGDIAKKIDETNAKIKSASDAQTGWTAGAAGGAAAIFVFTAGIGWPIALAWGLGAGFGGADQARKAKEDAEKLLAEQEGEQKKKTSLVFDIKGLNDQIGDIKDKVDAVAAGLKGIVGVWNNQVSVLDAIVTSTEIDALLEFSAINQRLRVADAATKWKQIATDTFEFTAYGFVEFRQAA